MKALARAHSNIALIKYWGKKDEALNLPLNGSLSLTLDAFYTDTYISFDEDIDKDIFSLNNQVQDEKATSRVVNFIDIFRKLSGINKKALIVSSNNFPTASGLASSASGFAALACACNAALNLNFDNKELSSIARLGSGSATRSIFGGFVEWLNTHAENIDDANWDVGMISVIVSKEEKTISSREGMKITQNTSPFYQQWLIQSKLDLMEIKEAIKNRDFELVGVITEKNSFNLHAIMLSSNPSLLYWESDTIKVIQIVKMLRKEGLSCYTTIDAGANVNILCRLSQADMIKKKLSEYFPEKNIIISKPGSGVKVL